MFSRDIEIVIWVILSYNLKSLIVLFWFDWKYIGFIMIVVIWLWKIVELVWILLILIIEGWCFECKLIIKLTIWWFILFFTPKRIYIIFILFIYCGVFRSFGFTLIAILWILALSSYIIPILIQISFWKLGLIFII